MKTLFTSLAFIVFTISTAMSSTAMAKNSQQSKMVTCNKEASGKTGDDRKAFMKDCLSSSHATAANSQQEKMKSCNASAAGKKGDERKAFMKSCLKKDS